MKGFNTEEPPQTTERMAEAIRNGKHANGFEGNWTRHRIVPSGGPTILMTPGVLALANAGAYWLLDLVISHVPRQYLERFDGRAFVKVEVPERPKGSKLGPCTVTIHGGFADDDPRQSPPIVQHIRHSDFPEGTLTLNITWVYPDGTFEGREPAILFPGEE